MKARLPEAAGGRPGPAGRSGPASFSGPSSRTKAGEAAGAGTPVSGALGAALAASLLAAATLLLAPGEARAQFCLGATTATNADVTCSAATYPVSIRSTIQSNANVTVRVPGGTGAGGTATVITGSTFYAGINLLASDQSQTGNYAIYVGTTAAVSIVDDTGSGNESPGIRIRQHGSGTATVDVRSQVTIGTSTSSRMRAHGIYVRSSGSGGAATITNAGTIYASYEGIDVQHDGAATTTVTHSGAIDSLNHGIQAVTDGAGALMVTSSGNITVTNANQQGIRMRAQKNGAMTLTATGGTITTPAQGIYMESQGTGTVTIQGTAASAPTQSGPTITSSASHGIHVHKSGSSATAGDVSITTTGGSITAGTGTSHGIHVQDRSGYTGNVTIDNAADVTASGGRGINVDRLGSGSVSVTVAAGTTVTGGTAGVYVAGAATGLQVARKYTSGYAQGQSADEIVTMAALRNQLVTVAGRVIGGTDAAVRLSGGGGVLVLEGGEVRAGADSGDSGVGILADGSALVYIDGLVRGAAGGAAAVHLTGGGSVTVGPNGRVQANGADHAIKSDGTNAITLTLVTAGMYREDAETAYARVDGSIEDVAAIRFREDLNGVPTGYSTSLTVTAAGVDTRKLPSRSQPPTEPPLSCPERADGRCIITQPGTISGRTGVYAAVEEDSATVASQPLIDVTWTGTFSHAEGNEGRFTAASAADVLSFDREAAAVKAQEAPEGSVRYGGAAGIEAHALSWRDVAEQVAKGDDPGALANAAAQTALVPTSATAHNNAYVKQFKAALENDEIEVESAVLTAIGTTATTAVTDLTDAQIVTYLRTDDEATRALLRNVLARGLSDAEKAVLRAVATNTGLDDALNDADAGFSNAYKTAVRDLLDRYNVGDIRIAVNGGSIDSRGDGIRAYYATPHANNGGISVTVAEGASVTGAMAGVYVANAGGDVTVSNSGTVKGGTYGIYAANAAAANGAIEVTVAAGASVTGDTAGVYAANAGPGLMLARKYTPGYSEENKDRAEELVPVMHGGGADAVPLLNQLVRVHGTVTGGTDAAVHLNGGGAVLVMEGGRVHAGTSGVAIKVNDPGPALVHVEGEVKGGAGPDGAPAPAAVHLTGGGNVIIGLNGKVKAAGAARAIRGGGDEATMVALTLVTDGIITHREDAQEAYARVEGSTEDIEGDVRFREDRDGVPTGYSRMLPVGDDGMLDASTLEWGPCPDETHIRGDDGVCGTPPPGSGDDGSGDDGSGSDGSGDDGSGDDGSGDDGSGDDGSGDDGSGDDGSGDDGSGDDGSGDDGSGDDGSGDDGSGDDGSGERRVRGRWVRERRVRGRRVRGRRPRRRGRRRHRLARRRHSRLLRDAPRRQRRHRGHRGRRRERVRQRGGHLRRERGAGPAHTEEIRAQGHPGAEGQRGRGQGRPDRHWGTQRGRRRHRDALPQPARHHCGHGDRGDGCGGALGRRRRGHRHEGGQGARRLLGRCDQGERPGPGAHVHRRRGEGRRGRGRGGASDRRRQRHHWPGREGGGQRGRPRHPGWRRRGDQGGPDPGHRRRHHVPGGRR